MPVKDSTSTEKYRTATRDLEDENPKSIEALSIKNFKLYKHRATMDTEIF